MVPRQKCSLPYRHRLLPRGKLRLHTGLNHGLGFTAKMLFDHDQAAAGAKAGAVLPPTSVAGFEAQAHGLRRYDARPLLPTVKTPTMVLVGAEDVLTPTFQSVEMAQLIPNARLQVLPRGSHGMVIEFTPETVAAIVAFLSEK